MGPEAKIEAYLKKRVLETGGRIRKLKWIGQRGAPDRMIWWPNADTSRSGRFLPITIFVEVKAPGKHATKQQDREHRRLRADGFEVWVINAKTSVDNLIFSLDERDPE